jgi:hypothetical protein
VHAVGRVNFLDDPSQTPHCKPKVIYEFLGIGESTDQNKSKEIRDLLKMGPMSPQLDLAQPACGSPDGVAVAGQRFYGRHSRNAHRSTADGF